MALFLNLGGDELLKIYNSFEFPTPDDSGTDPAKNLTTLLAKFDAHFAPRKTTLIDRYKFHKCLQLSGETLEAFITRPKVLTKDCDFKIEKDDLLRDDELREKFFREEDLTRQQAAAFQASQKKMLIYKDGTQEPVDRVSHKPTNKPNQVKQAAKPETSPAPKQLKPCKFCGTKQNAQHTARHAASATRRIIWQQNVGEEHDRRRDQQEIPFMVYKMTLMMTLRCSM